MILKRPKQGRGGIMHRMFFAGQAMRVFNSRQTFKPTTLIEKGEILMKTSTFYRAGLALLAGLAYSTATADERALDQEYPNWQSIPTNASAEAITPRKAAEPMTCENGVWRANLVYSRSKAWARSQGQDSDRLEAVVPAGQLDKFSACGQDFQITEGSTIVDMSSPIDANKSDIEIRRIQAERLVHKRLYMSQRDNFGLLLGTGKHNATLSFATMGITSIKAKLSFDF